MNGYKQNMRPLQSIIYLLSLLSLFTLIIAPPVFASTDYSLAEPPSISTPRDAAGAPTDQGFARASGSVKLRRDYMQLTNNG